MLEYRSAFTELDAAGTPLGGFAHVSVRPVSDRAWLLVQGDPQDARLRDAIARHTGLSLPEPVHVSLSDTRALLWMTPKEWLLEIPLDERTTCASVLASALPRDAAVLTDLTDALVGVDLNGARAAEILSAGTGVDLESEALTSDRVARIALAETVVILRRLPAGGFRCLLDRSHLAYFQDWLVTQA